MSRLIVICTAQKHAETSGKSEKSAQHSLCGRPPRVIADREAYLLDYAHMEYVRSSAPRCDCRPRTYPLDYMHRESVQASNIVVCVWSVNYMDIAGSLIHIRDPARILTRVRHGTRHRGSEKEIHTPCDWMRLLRRGRVAVHATEARM